MLCYVTYKNNNISFISQKKWKRESSVETCTSVTGNYNNLICGIFSEVLMVVLGVNKSMVITVSDLNFGAWYDLP